MKVCSQFSRNRCSDLYNSSCSFDRSYLLFNLNKLVNVFRSVGDNIGLRISFGNAHIRDD